MPLKYLPAQLKFAKFKAMPDKAVAGFAELVGEIAQGTEKEKTVFEDFKNAFGITWPSNALFFCSEDLMKRMNNVKPNAVKFVAAFYRHGESGQAWSRVAA